MNQHCFQWQTNTTNKHNKKNKIGRTKGMNEKDEQKGQAKL